MLHVGAVKSTESERKMSLDVELLEVINSWKQTTQFSAEEDWIFARPAQLEGCRSAIGTFGSSSKRQPWRRPSRNSVRIPSGRLTALGWMLHEHR
jgi:hypothetical protein